MGVKHSVLLVASEVYPLVKVGGLADFVSGLATGLAHLGWPTTVLIPRYRWLPEGRAIATDTVTLGGQPFPVRYAEQLSAAGGRTVTVDCPPLFEFDSLSAGLDGGDPDTARSFAMLSLAALHFAAKHVPLPCVVHSNDWQTGLVPFYLRTRPELAELRANAATVFSVHNLAYQGIFDAQLLSSLDIPGSEFHVGGLEYWGQINFMKAGILGADFITTVSPTYAKEIQLPEFGFGMDGIFRQRSSDLIGIIDGVDTGSWDPASDMFLAEHYDSERLDGKRACRHALQAECGLMPNDDSLLLAVVGRLTSQKGVDLLLAVLPELVASGAQLVVLGSGDPSLEAALRQAQLAYPGRLHVHIGYDEARAHWIVAGSDALLMPSRFEPCGITQLYALRYGTLPIVRSTGGLADSVDADVGFKFERFDPRSLLDALAAAGVVFHRDPARWRSMMVEAMRRDQSWGGTARNYARVYGEALARSCGLQISF